MQIPIFFAPFLSSLDRRLRRLSADLRHIVGEIEQDRRRRVACTRSPVAAPSYRIPFVPINRSFAETRVSRVREEALGAFLQM